MRRMVLLTAVIVLSVTGIAQAEEGELGIDFDATWVSKYIWRGFDLYDDKAAFQPSINVDLYGTGFSFNLWGSYGGSSGTVDGEEMDYTLTYSNTVFDSEVYMTNYAVSWLYYDFPDATSKNADAQEFNLALSWPNLCPGGVVPHYQVIKMWPSFGGGAARDISGFIHVWGLNYETMCPELDLPFVLSWDIVYNDGTGGDSVDHDWSHMVWGIKTRIECPMGGTLTPALYFQNSMDDSVNDEDELWVGLSYGFGF